MLWASGTECGHLGSCKIVDLLFRKGSPILALQQKIELLSDNVCQPLFRPDVYRLNFSGLAQHEKGREALSLEFGPDLRGVVGAGRHRHRHAEFEVPKMLERLFLRARPPACTALVQVKGQNFNSLIRVFLMSDSIQGRDFLQ